MSDQAMTTVDLGFDDKWEGLEYHRFFWERCCHRIMLQSMRLENGLFWYPGHTIFEYDEERAENESYYAYSMLQVWFSWWRVRNTQVRFHFADKAEATLFKLTFGGAV